MEEEKKTTLDEMMKSIMTDAAKANQPTAEINHEVVTMLFGIYQQNEDNAEINKEIRDLLTRLLEKKPVEVKTQEVKLPSIMEVEEVSPVKEIKVSNLDSINFPDTKKYFDSLSTENNKGQFAIIDAVDRLTEFLKSIDWSKLREKHSDFGGVINPSWHIETPTGSIDSSNRTFTLETTPRQNSLFLFLGGILQTENEDYTINRNTITYTNAPPTGVTPHVARFQV
jgi:hypothetical protein